MALDSPLVPSEIGGASADRATSTDYVAVAPSELVPEKLSPEEVVTILEGYRVEAEYARLAGPSSRDLTWLSHLDLYWNRFDFSKKAAWQAREVLPEFPQYVDRFAAALRTTLLSSEFFTVKVNNDKDNALGNIIRKVMKVVLSRIGRTPSGQRCDFLVTFEEAMKYGALMNPVTLVASRVIDGVRTTVLENIDPYNYWHDPTGRNLYRIRRLEMDLNEFQALAKKFDGKGQPLYYPEEIKDVHNTAAGVMEALQRAEREKRTGTGQWQTSNRRPIILHEYYGTLIDSEGNTVGENVLCITANNYKLVRGPEANPFAHGRDWIVAATLLPVPGAPYGRSYVENFASIARTLNELTNLVLDAVFTSAMKAFSVVPSMLEDPSQIDEGVYPNVVFRLNDGALPGDFLKEVNLGQLPPEVMGLWQALKKELQEGAAFSDLSLGQPAPHSRTSATEIGTSEQNSNTLIRSIASNIECLYLEPLLDLIWLTTIQFLDPKDKELADAVGEEWWPALLKGKRELSKMRVNFICRGISSLINKQQKLQQLMQLMQVVGQNQSLAQQFMQEVDPARLLTYLFELFDVDPERIMLSPRDKQVKQLAEQQAQQQQQKQQQSQMVLSAILGQAGKAAGGAGKPPSGAPGPQGQAVPPGGPQPSAGPGGGQRVPAAAGPPAAAGGPGGGI